jgi:hypothetical protein
MNESPMNDESWAARAFGEADEAVEILDGMDGATPVPVGIQSVLKGDRDIRVAQEGRLPLDGAVPPIHDGACTTYPDGTCRSLHCVRCGKQSGMTAHQQCFPELFPGGKPSWPRIYDLMAFAPAGAELTPVDDPDAPTGPLTPGQVMCVDCRLDDRTRAATDDLKRLCDVCQEGGDARNGHQFHFSVRVQAAYRIPHGAYVDAPNEGSDAFLLTVRAWDLAAACRKAWHTELKDWYQDEGLPDRDEERQQMVADAMRCADRKSATYWPAVAGILADEVERLRTQLGVARYQLSKAKGEQDA